MAQCEWIPIEKETPDFGRPVLLNLKCGAIRIGQHNGHVFFIPQEAMFTSEVIAWQKLPEPYKKEGL